MKKTLKYTILIIAAFILGSVVLGGCSSSPAETQALNDHTADADPTATQLPQLVAPTAEPETVDECLACHQEKERLVDTAKPEEEHVSENEGEG